VENRLPAGVQISTTDGWVGHAGRLWRVYFFLPLHTTR